MTKKNLVTGLMVVGSLVLVVGGGIVFNKTVKAQAGRDLVEPMIVQQQEQQQEIGNSGCSKASNGTCPKKNGGGCPKANGSSCSKQSSGGRSKAASSSCGCGK